MNDLTLEELNEIQRCVKYMIEGRWTTYSCLTIQLDKKIRVLIDNYCEHECNHKITIEEGDLIGACEKCNALFKMSENEIPIRIANDNQ